LAASRRRLRVSNRTKGQPTSSRALFLFERCRAFALYTYSSFAAAAAAAGEHKLFVSRAVLTFYIYRTQPASFSARRFKSLKNTWASKYLDTTELR